MRYVLFTIIALCAFGIPVASQQCRQLPVNPYDVDPSTQTKPKPSQLWTVTKSLGKEGLTTTVTTTTDVDPSLPTTTPTPKPPTPTPSATPDNISFPIPINGLPIKLSMDQDVDSGYLKNLDYVQLVVAENVEMLGDNGTQNCIIVPKDTKVFGIVDKSRGRHILRIGGVAQLFIYLTSIKLDNGLEYPINFELPDEIYDGRTGAIHKDKDNVIVPCYNHPSNIKCIQGRLTRTTVSANVIGGGAQGAVGFSNGSAKSVARITLIQDIANSAGLDAVINQPNAAFKKGHIFQALMKPRQDGQPVWRVRGKKDAPTTGTKADEKPK